MAVLKALPRMTVALAHSLSKRSNLFSVWLIPPISKRRLNKKFAIVGTLRTSPCLGGPFFLGGGLYTLKSSLAKVSRKSGIVYA